MARVLVPAHLVIPRNTEYILCDKPASEGKVRRPRPSVAQRMKVAELQDWRCNMCNVLLPSTWELDHIVRVTDDPSIAQDLINHQALCPGCHREKTALENGYAGDPVRGTRPQFYGRSPFSFREWDSLVERNLSEVGIPRDPPSLSSSASLPEAHRWYNVDPVPAPPTQVHNGFSQALKKYRYTSTCRACGSSFLGSSCLCEMESKHNRKTHR